MTYRVVILRRATEDVDIILTWLVKRSRAGAVRWHEAYQMSWTTLESNPDRHPLAPESNDVGKEIREVLFHLKSGKRYRILFTIEGSEVIIWRVRGPGERPISRDDFE